MVKFLSHTDLELARVMEEFVMYVYSVSRENIYSKDRQKFHIKPRYVLYLLLKKKAGWSLSDIARRYKKNHTTIHHALRRAEERGWDSETKDFKPSMFGASYPPIHSPIIISINN